MITQARPNAFPQTKKDRLVGGLFTTEQGAELNKHLDDASRWPL